MLHLSHSLTHINCRTLWHSHTSSESFLCIGESALTDTVHHLQYSTVEHQLMDYLYKTASTILYTFKLVPAQPVLTFEISLFFSPARKHLGFTFVPTYSFQHIQSFLSFNNQHTISPLTILCHCATFHSPHPQSVRSVFSAAPLLSHEGATVREC